MLMKFLNGASGRVDHRTLIWPSKPVIAAFASLDDVSRTKGAAEQNQVL